jgi:hypothetical protein
MLSLYGSFKVPDVNVMLYRDDENPHKFYMLPERPTIARDDQGKPLFTFILYARDLDRIAPDDREVERGYLALSTQVAVTTEQEQKIRTHLRAMLNNELGRGYRFLRFPVLQAEPELSYPPLFTSGSVEFVTFNDTSLVPFSTGSKVPSLINTNLASFSQSLSQDGAELFRQAIEKGKFPAIINYGLKFAARIPAITIRIHGDRGEFYQELKNFVTQQHHTRTEYLWGLVTYDYYYTTEEFRGISQFRNSFHSLTIEVDDADFRDADPSDDSKKKLEDMAFDILKNTILPDFFKAVLTEATAEERDDLRIREIRKQMTGTVDVTIRRTAVIEQPVNPNSQLAQVLTAEEIAENTVYLDLSQQVFEELDVKVSANVNFASDPVFGLKVFLDYDQMDEKRNVRVKNAKEFLFKNADTVHRFRQIMAKSADSAPKDGYKYWSEIIYRDTGETVRVPSSGSLDSRERELVISYRRLGFIKVAIMMGSMPDNVRSVQVKMRYPNSSLPGAQQSFELTREKPTATFFSYTGMSGDPGPYRYSLTYVLADGQRMDVTEQSSISETLTITDPFDRTITTRFLAEGDFTVVDKIIVDAHYKDPANDFFSDYHTEFTKNGDTAEWKLGLRDVNRREYEYDVIIVYKNGSREVKPTVRRTLGETVPVGSGAIDALNVTIIASLLDWTKYRLAIVFVEYNDDANNIHEAKNFTFRQTNSEVDVNWRVLLRDKQKKSFRYRVRLLAENSADNKEIPWTETNDPVLVLEG